MIELVFVACLATASDECRQRSLVFSDISMMTCMSQAQIPLAQWSAGHPNWDVKRWSCQIVDHSVARL